MPKQNSKKSAPPRNKKAQDLRDGRLPKGGPAKVKPAALLLNSVKVGPQQAKASDAITVEVVSGSVFDTDCSVLFEEIDSQVKTPGDKTGLQGNKRLLAQVPNLGKDSARFRVVVEYADGSFSDPNPTGVDEFDYESQDGITAMKLTVGAPMVTGLNPDHGPCAGGGNVTISGTNFPVPPGVWFGNARATINNPPAPTPTSISVVVPGQQAGTVEVVVSNPAHTLKSTPNQPWDLYTYADQPGVTGVSPASGPATGNTPVTITGTNFTSFTAVSFGADLATSFVVVKSSPITAQPPAEPAGAVDVVVTNPAGNSPVNRPGDLFTYS